MRLALAASSVLLALTIALSGPAAAPIVSGGSAGFAIGGRF